MTYRLSTVSIIVASLIYVFPNNLLAADYAYELETAVNRHQSNAPDAELELGIVDELAGLSEKAPTAWLPDYWAAYILTQITRSHDVDRVGRLERAKIHLERALKRAEDDPAAPAADLHALQSHVYSFLISIQPDEDSKDQMRALMEAETTRSNELDPQSPVVMVHAGTDLISDGQSEKDWVKIMGGVALLERANDIFAATREPKGLTTHYNSEWIDPWADWAYRLYEGGFDAD